MSAPSPPRLVLASSSPRRKEIIALLGVPFEVGIVPTNETPLPDESPDNTVARLASQKARAVAPLVSGSFVVAADTIVVLDGEILRKPRYAVEARSMLRRLRHRDHLVITGVAVVAPGCAGESITSTASVVTMRDYSDAEIDAYVGSGEPFDKAGGYAVQSPRFKPASKVDGCYLNVVGLPLCAVAANLCSTGYPLPPVPSTSLGSACQTCPQREFLIHGCT